MSVLTLLLGVGHGLGCVLMDQDHASPAGQLPGPDPLGPPGERFWNLMPSSGIQPPKPRDEVQVTRVELRLAGELVDRTLRASGMEHIWERLLQLQGRAGSTGTPLTLAIDAKTPGLRALPWELLGGLRPGESPLAGVRVARICETRLSSSPPTLRERLEILVWSPDPTDPECRRVVEALEQNIGGLERGSLTRVDPGVELEPDDRVYRILHVVCHGRSVLDAVVLQLAPGVSRAADAVARPLGRLLRSVGLVVLDICGGASDTSAPLDAPAMRLVAEGAPACIAPRLALAGEASIAFSEGLYQALDRSLSLVEATEAGRNVLLRSSVVVHPYWRWWNPTLVVAGLKGLRSSPPLEPRQRIPGWPLGARELDGRIAAALDLAHPAGFLGVEQLAQAMAASVTGQHAGLLQQLLEPVLVSLSLLNPSSSKGLLPLTPRLAALGEVLPAGFRLPALAGAVFESPGILALLGSRNARAARAMVEAAAEGRAPAVREERGSGAVGAAQLETADVAVELEVLGGPDDGLRLSLAPGQSVGRWAPDRADEAPPRLLAPPRPGSRQVSRDHLVLFPPTLSANDASSCAPPGGA